MGPKILTSAPYAPLATSSCSSGRARIASLLRHPRAAQQPLLVGIVLIGRRRCASEHTETAAAPPDPAPVLRAASPEGLGVHRVGDLPLGPLGCIGEWP